MVREYHVYSADIWASVVGEKMTNSRLVGGTLADRCCSMNTAYCHMSHFPQTRYRRRLTGVHGGSTGVWKAVRTLEIPLLGASTCLIARSKVVVKISTVKIFAVFIFVSRGFIQNLHRTKISRYTVSIHWLEPNHKQSTSFIGGNNETARGPTYLFTVYTLVSNTINFLYSHGEIRHHHCTTTRSKWGGIS